MSISTDFPVEALLAAQILRVPNPVTGVTTEWVPREEYDRVCKQRNVLFPALLEMESMYSHAFDTVGGGLFMGKKSVERFDAACEKARAAIKEAAE